MKRGLLLLVLAACGGPEAGGGGQVPLGLVLDEASPSSLGQLQFTLLMNPEKYDCGTITTTCLKNQVDPSDIVMLTGPNGQSEQAFVVTLSSDPSNQTFDVTGLPVLDQKLTLVVEGVTLGTPVLGASGCTNLPGIVEGTNPTVSVTLNPPPSMQTCDPLF